MDAEDGQEESEAPVDEPVLEYSESGRYARFNQILGRGAFKTGAVATSSAPLMLLGPALGRSSVPCCAPATHRACCYFRMRWVQAPSCFPLTGSKAGPCIRCSESVGARPAANATLTPFARPFARSVQGFRRGGGHGGGVEPGPGQRAGQQ